MTEQEKIDRADLVIFSIQLWLRDLVNVTTPIILNLDPSRFHSVSSKVVIYA